MFGNHPFETAGDQTQRVVPANLLPKDLRGQQPILQPNGFAQGAALGTEPPPVRRMVGVALASQPAGAIRGRKDTATDTATGAGRANRGPVRHAATCRARRLPSSRMRPASTRTG